MAAPTTATATATTATPAPAAAATTTTTKPVCPTATHNATYWVRVRSPHRSPYPIPISSFLHSQIQQPLRPHLNTITRHIHTHPTTSTGLQPRGHLRQQQPLDVAPQFIDVLPRTFPDEPLQQPAEPEPAAPSCQDEERAWRERAASCRSVCKQGRWDGYIWEYW